MMWNGYSAWMWLMMLPALVLVWGLLAWVIVPAARQGRGGPLTPLDRLDGRLAAGEIDVDQYRTLRSELERHS